MPCALAHDGQRLAHAGVVGAKNHHPPRQIEAAIDSSCDMSGVHVSGVGNNAKDLVLDLSGMGQLFGLPAEVPVLLSYESHPITAPLTRIPTAYPLARSLDIKSGDKTTVSKLFGTTEDSVAVTGIGPGGAIGTKKGKKGPLTLGVAGAYKGATAGRFIVVGTSLWAQNSILGSRSLGNRDLLGNMINWLSSDEDLISIRPKEPEDRPLTLTTQKLSSIFWLSFVIFPLGVVAIGMATWWKRR